MGRIRSLEQPDPKSPPKNLSAYYVDQIWSKNIMNQIHFYIIYFEPDPRVLFFTLDSNPWLVDKMVSERGSAQSLRTLDFFKAFDYIQSVINWNKYYHGYKMAAQDPVSTKMLDIFEMRNCSLICPIISGLESGGGSSEEIANYLQCILWFKIINFQFLNVLCLSFNNIKILNSHLPPNHPSPQPSSLVAKFFGWNCC